MSTAGAPGLGVAAARAVLWTGGGQFARQLVQLGSSLVLVRLLAPDDFGLLAMALFFVGIGQLLGDFGIGTAVIQSRSDDPVVLSSCFWLNLAVAATVSAVVVAAAPLVARFYGRAEVAPMVMALAFNMVIGALQAIPGALLAGALRFREVAKAQVAGSAAGAATAIAMAWAGAGLWALVAQPLVGSATTLLVMATTARWLPRLCWSWSGLAPMARFSTAVLATNLVNYANRNVDSLLVGRVLGAGALGIYSMAIQLMLYPLQHVSSVFVRVLFPTLAQIKDDLPRLRAIYLRTVGTIALVTFPIMGGLFALADDFVLVVFGAQWQAMTPVLRVLAWLGMLQSVGTTTGTLYLSQGRADIALKVTLVGAPVLIGGMAAGLPWGILGVAVGYATASLSLLYFTLVTAFQLVGLQLKDVLRALWRPFVATLAMVVAIAASAQLLDGVVAAARLAAGITVGIAVYLTMSALINGEKVRETLSMLRSLRSDR